MDVSLKRPCLAEQVADVIKRRIAQGQWKEVMPSHRGLSTLLQVSRSTLESAFGILEGEGVIKIRSKRRALIVRPSRLEHLAGPYRVGWLEGRPLPLFSSSELRDMLFLQIAELEARHEFVLIPVGVGRARFSPSVLQRLLRRNRVSHCVLVNQPESVLTWIAEQGVNACVLGACPPSITSLSSLNLSRVAAIRHASGLLQSRGHRKILFLTWKSTIYELICVEQAFLGSGSSSEIKLFVRHHDGTKAGLQAKLETIFRHGEPPDALIVAGGVFALSTYTTLLSRYRLRVPKDVSFISLDSDLSFPHLSPQPAHYSWGVTRIGRRLFQLIHRMDQNKLPLHAEMAPVFIPGETVRPKNLA